MPVSWDKVDGLVRKQIDTASDKYRGSNSRQLLIHCVCKDDEAGYQAVISRNQDVRIFSNKVHLRAIGGILLFENHDFQSFISLFYFDCHNRHISIVEIKLKYLLILDLVTY